MLAGSGVALGAGVTAALVGCGDDDDDDDAPVATAAPATEAPEEATEAPAEATEAPAEATEAPAEATEARRRRRLPSPTRLPRPARSREARSATPCRETCS